MASEEGLFGFEDVAAGIAEKMRRRHPHVLGTEAERADGKQDGSWEQIKETERAGKDDSSVIAGVARGCPR